MRRWREPQQTHSKQSVAKHNSTAPPHSYRTSRSNIQASDMHSRKHSPHKYHEADRVVVMEEGSPSKPTVTDDDNFSENEKLLPLHHSNNHDADASSSNNNPAHPTQAKKIGTALFYAASSLGVIFANKIVLSTYKFPSVQTLALFQFTSTTLALKVASMLGYVSLLPISVKGIKSILPLSTCYLLNILTGLSATQNLSLPMMVLLRRASILMTMVSCFSNDNNRCIHVMFQ